MKKIIAVTLFCVFMAASTAFAGLDLYDGDGNRIGQVISKGMLEQDTWGVQVFVESIGKFARISEVDSLHADVVDLAPNCNRMYVAEGIGTWDGKYFTSGSFRFRGSLAYPVMECQECYSIFPLKLPLQYVPAQ